MIVDTVLVLFLVLAIIATTIILVVKEFKKVKDRLKYEESLSRVNETVLGSNLTLASRNLLGVINRESTNLQTRMALSNSTLNNLINTNQKLVTDELGTYRNNVLALQDSVVKNQKGVMDEMGSLGTKVTGLEAQDTLLASHISTLNTTMSNMTYGLNMYDPSSNFKSTVTNDPLLGLTLSNNNPNGKADANFNRAHVGTSLNIAGTLNFANNNSSYMLGIDGTSLYLKMADSNKFVVRDNTDIDRLSVAQNSVRVGTDLELTNGAQTNFTFNVTGNDLNIRPSITANNNAGIHIRDNQNVSRLMIRDSNINFEGSTVTYGPLSVSGTLNSQHVVSDTDLCIKQTCLTESDLTALKALTQTPAKITA